MSQHAPEHRTRWVRGDRPGDDGLHLSEASLLSTKHVRLDPETEDRIPSLRTIAMAYRLGDQPLSLIESAVEEGPHHERGEHEPTLGWLTELVDQQ